MERKLPQACHRLLRAELTHSVRLVNERTFPHVPSIIKLLPDGVATPQVLPLLTVSPCFLAVSLVPNI